MADPRLPQEDALDRIAAALEKLAPKKQEPVDWLSAPAYVWDGQHGASIAEPDARPLHQLRGIDQQKSSVRTNLARHAQGAAAHDILLWGARGMGKSALIRAAMVDLQTENPSRIALIQLSSDAVGTLPLLLAELADCHRAFLLFVDDLGFGPDEFQTNLALRSMLDGSIQARPRNVLLAVTTNRRAIVARDWEEREALHARDERDNSLALADRFGLTLGFHPCDQETYLEIVRAYTDPLDISINEEEAATWAIERGNRSGRTAFQFACELAGRAGLNL